MDLQGNEFALTPENKVSLNATYFWDMLELDWPVTGSYDCQGNQWMTPFNDPLATRRQAVGTAGSVYYCR